MVCLVSTASKETVASPALQDLLDPLVHPAHLVGTGPRDCQDSPERAVLLVYLEYLA